MNIKLSFLALGSSFRVGADIRQVVELPRLANTAAWVRLGVSYFFLYQTPI